MCAVKAIATTPHVAYWDSYYVDTRGHGVDNVQMNRLDGAIDSFVVLVDTKRL